MTDQKGPWTVDIVFNDGADTLHGVEKLERNELAGLINNIGEPDGALGVVNEDGVLVVVPATRVLEIHAKPVAEDD